MAIKFATINGSWSNTSIWNGGSLPAITDDVFANGRTVNIDQNIQVKSLNTTLGGGTAGGSFNVTTNGIFITASDILSGLSNCLIISLSGNQIVNINSNLYNGTYSSNALRIAGGIVNLTGNVTCGSGAGTGILATNDCLYSTNASTTNFTGNILGGSGSTSTGAKFENSSRLNIIGNITGGRGNSAYGLLIYSGASLVATGSVTGGSVGVNNYGLHVYQSSNCITTISGTLSGGSGVNSFGAYYSSGGTLNVTGNMVGGSGNASYGAWLISGITNLNGLLRGGNGTSAVGLYVQSCAETTITGNINSGLASGASGLYTLGTVFLTINGTVSSTNNAASPITLFSSGLVTINGTIRNQVSATSLYYYSSTSVVVNGNQIASGTGSEITRDKFQNTEPGTLTINGNILGSETGVNSCFINGIGLADITINGNITQRNIPSIVIPQGNLGGLIRTKSANTIINGNVTGGSSINSPAIYSDGTNALNSINVTGTITGGGTGSPGVNLTTSPSTLTVTGGIVAGTWSPAVLALQPTMRTIVKGNVTNRGNMQAHFGWKLVIGNSEAGAFSIQAQNGSSRSISTSNSLAGLPAETDVRLGLTYGIDGSLTGIMAVPTASHVSYGISVDDTVGSGVISAADVAAIIAGFQY
jgi:hypothetical protein